MSKNKYRPTEAYKCLDGISKKRLDEMMDNGEISYTTEDWGAGQRRIIEGSELARVFGDKFNPSETNEMNSDLDLEVKFLRQRIKDKDTIIAEKTEQIKKNEALIDNFSRKLDQAQKTLNNHIKLIKTLQKPLVK